MPRSKLQRSRVTNGKSLFVSTKAPMNAAWTRRMVDVMEAHISDLGGDDRISEAQRSIARRAAFLTTELENIEQQFACGKGSPETLDLYHRITGTLLRCLGGIGLDRVARDITPDLRDYLNGKAAQQ